MMLGTFTNGTGVNAAPYGYTMAGKTGTTETDFNPDLSGDQWVIGYTPDVVISQWLGFPKTDETHYLTGTSAETASVIFRNVANSVLPYTEGTSFDNEKILTRKMELLLSVKKQKRRVQKRTRASLIRSKNALQGS